MDAETMKPIRALMDADTKMKAIRALMDAETMKESKEVDNINNGPEDARRIIDMYMYRSRSR